MDLGGPRNTRKDAKKIKRLTQRSRRSKSKYLSCPHPTGSQFHPIS